MLKTWCTVAFIVFITFVASGQPKQFVCTPCGQECDNKTLDHGGSCSSCGMDLVEKSTVKFSNLTLEELCARIKANPKLVLLDVRSPQEFGGTTSDVPTYGHFKNAVNVNVTDLERRIKELTKYKDDEVVVYCSHSHRSPRATYILATQGFKNVSNLAGGVSTLSGQQGNECLKNNFVFH